MNNRVLLNNKRNNGCVANYIPELYCSYSRRKKIIVQTKIHGQILE